MYRSYLKRFAFIIVSLMLASGCGTSERRAARSEPPSVQITAGVDKAAANPGDIVTFTLAADYAPKIQVELPEITDRFSDFRLVNSGVLGPAEKNGRMHVERWYKLQANSPGSYVLEPVEVEYTLADGTKQAVKTPRIFLEVESLLEQHKDETDIRDIKPPLPVNRSYRFLIPVLIGAVALILLFLVGKWLTKRYHRKQEMALMRKPPHEEALEALERLLMRQLIEQGRAREFCFEISGILRRYIEARFAVPAIDLTSEEVLVQVDERKGLIEPETRPILVEFLTETDLVKFAKYRPTTVEVEKIIQATTDFVGKTTPLSNGADSQPELMEKHREHVSV